MPNTEQLLYQTDKSSHRRCSIKNAVLKNFAIFTGQHLCWSLFFNFIKKRLQQRCFTVAKFCCEIFKNTYFEEHLRTAASELTLENDYLELCF